MIFELCKLFLVSVTTQYFCMNVANIKNQNNIDIHVHISDRIGNILMLLYEGRLINFHKINFQKRNIQRFFSDVTIENFIKQNLIFLLFLLKTLIVGTR